MTRFFIPPDNDRLREQYENTPKQGGTCGVAAMAALKRTTVQSIIDAWVGKGERGWPGYSPIREMKATLEKLGYQAKVCKGRKAKEFPFIDCMAAIVRIQWLDEDGGQFPWFEAARHTHYVLLAWQAGSLYVFCNGTGWFPAEGTFARKYLRPGYISSYIEVSR